MGAMRWSVWWRDLDRREARVFVWSAGALFVAGVAEVFVANVGETLFIKRVGVEQLPWVYAPSAFLLVLYPPFLAASRRLCWLLPGQPHHQR